MGKRSQGYAIAGNTVTGERGIFRLQLSPVQVMATTGEGDVLVTQVRLLGAGLVVAVFAVLFAVGAHMGILAVTISAVLIQAVTILVVAVFAAWSVCAFKHTVEFVKTPGAEEHDDEREFDAVSRESNSITTGAEHPENAETEGGAHDRDCDDETVEKRLPEATHSGSP